MKKFIEELFGLIGILMICTLPLSFIMALACPYKESVCDQKAYYLPATFIFCQLSEKR